ncbi:MAG: sigma-70 family RNA polymerase sigma factor [Chloroflexota bacterium]|nr:sigma-70 family RNA polymerase sigma factor [Chloroflexota bacterium]
MGSSQWLPFLRLQSDDRLVGLTRAGSHAAFEVLTARYRPRVLAFCRSILGSEEDAEDVLQDVLLTAYKAILAGGAIQLRPWLYRVARNASLNHLSRARAVGVDSMDVYLAGPGLATAEKVQKREEFRLLLADLQKLPETQRTALVLRQIDSLSYEQTAEVMEPSVSSVKSLLVRARVALAEASEGREASCTEVRLELGEAVEGLKRISSQVRGHLHACDDCSAFRAQLKQTNRTLAAVFAPVGLLGLLGELKQLLPWDAGAAGGGATASGSVVGSVASVASVASVGVGVGTNKTLVALATGVIAATGTTEIRKEPSGSANSTPAARQGLKEESLPAQLTYRPSATIHAADNPATSRDRPPRAGRAQAADRRASEPVEEAATPVKSASATAAHARPKAQLKPAATQPEADGTNTPAPAITEVTKVLPPDTVQTPAEATVQGVPDPATTNSATATTNSATVSPTQASKNEANANVVAQSTKTQVLAQTQR